MASQSEILFHEILVVQKTPPRWLNNVFLFRTEIWVEKLKNHPVLKDHLVLVGRDDPLEGMAHHGEGDRGLGQSGKV